MSDEVLVADHSIEYTYTRSTGPMIGAFLTGLRDGKFIGSRGVDGRVIVPAVDYDRARATIETAKAAIGYDRLDGATDVAKVSVIGIGMRSHAGVAARAFKALSERNINIRAITSSEIKFSVLIDAAYTELAVRTLHTLYGLDKA